MPGGCWYTIKVEVRNGEGLMKVWAKTEKEPDRWDLSFPLSDRVESVSGVGMRTFGQPVKYDDLTFSVREMPLLTFEQEGVSAALTQSGMLRSLRFSPKGEKVQFRQCGRWAGPAWLDEGKPVRLSRERERGIAFQDDLRIVFISWHIGSKTVDWESPRLYAMRARLCFRRRLSG